VRHWLLHWLLSAVALLIVANIVPGIEVDSFGSALAAAVVIGLVSATLGFFLKLVLLPFIVITLGVVYFVINGMMLMLASALVPGFRVRGLMAATGGSIVLTIVDYLLSQLV
jgi:putative membrane protein